MSAARRGRWGLAFVVVAVLAVSAAGTYYWYGGRPAPGAANAQDGGGDAQTQGVPVEAAEVIVDSVTRAIDAVGSLRANEAVVVSSEVAGRVAEILFEEGDRVEQGTVLARLDSEVVRAQLAEAQASLELSRSNYERTKQLFDRKTAPASVRDEAFARMRQDEASVALAAAMLRKTELRAPFDGIVGLRNVSVGEYIAPGDALVDLVQVNPIKVDFRIPEVFTAAVAAGQIIRLSVDALPDRMFEGTVYALSPSIDESGRSLLMRATIPNDDGALMPGMFARVALVIDVRQNAVLVPEESVFPVAEDHFVFRVVDGKAEQTRVKIGLRKDTRVEIVDGLAPGDVVITAGHLKIRDGVPVTVLPMPEAPAQS